MESIVYFKWKMVDEGMDVTLIDMLDEVSQMFVSIELGVSMN